MWRVPLRSIHASNNCPTCTVFRDAGGADLHAESRWHGEPGAYLLGVVAGVNLLALTTGKDPPPERKLQWGYRYESDKFAVAGLTPVDSEVVKAPRVLECPVQIEGVVHHYRSFGKNVGAHVFEVHIVKLHVAGELLSELEPSINLLAVADLGFLRRHAHEDHPIADAALTPEIVGDVVFPFFVVELNEHFTLKRVVDGKFGWVARLPAMRVTRQVASTLCATDANFWR